MAIFTAIATAAAATLGITSTFAISFGATATVGEAYVKFDPADFHGIA